MDIGQLIIAIAAFIGAGSGVWGLWQQRKKILAEAKKTEEERKKIKIETAEIVQRVAAEQLEQQQKYFEEKEEDYNKRIDILEKGAKELKAIITVLRNDLDEVLDSLIHCAEGARLLYDQVKTYEEPAYTPMPVDFIKKKKKAIKEKTQPRKTEE